MAKTILDILSKPHNLISFVEDRLGHDKRYSINCDKIKNKLGYIPEYTIENGLRKTIDWIKNDK